MLQGEANEMACNGHGVFFGCGLSLLILGLFLDIGGFASQYWINYDIKEEKMKIHSGLLQTCHSLSEKDDDNNFKLWCCQDIENTPDWLKTVRAFGVLGIVLLLFAIVSALFKIRLKDRPVVIIITVVFAFISAFCNIITVAVFARNYKDFFYRADHANFHFSFVFCVLSIVLGGVAGLSMIIEVFKRSSYSPI